MTTTHLENPVTQPQALALRSLPPLGLGSQLIGKEEEDLVLDVVRRKEPFRYYGRGSTPPPMAATLELEFREKFEVKYALAVTSGTAALEVALGALGVGPGDEVIVPAWSWISCFTAIVRLGALPVLAEIDETFCLAPGEITRLSTPATRAVLIVHYQGVAADMELLLEEARRANIKVLEDCAESVGASYKGKRIGTLGDIGIYSFQYQKVITSGEGGMVVTNEPLLYERAVRMHDIGNLRPNHRSLLESTNQAPQVPAFCGSQFRIGELAAAMALAQFRKIDDLIARCRSVSQIVLDEIRDLPGITFRRIPDPAGDIGFEIYLCLETAELAAAFREQLGALNVYANKTTGTYCHYAHEYCRLGQAHAPSASPFQNFEKWPAPGYREEDFPRTNALVERFVALPVGVLFTPEDARYIAQCVRYVHGKLVG